MTPPLTIVVFPRELRHLSPEQLDQVYMGLSTIACEIFKGGNRVGQVRMILDHESLD